MRSWWLSWVGGSCRVEEVQLIGLPTWRGKLTTPHGSAGILSPPSEPFASTFVESRDCLGSSRHLLPHSAAGSMKPWCPPVRCLALLQRVEVRPARYMQCVPLAASPRELDARPTEALSSVGGLPHLQRPAFAPLLRGAHPARGDAGGVALRYHDRLQRRGIERTHARTCCSLRLAFGWALL